MATYNEIRKTVVVHTLLGDDNSFTFSDTATSKAGSMALADLKAGRDIAQNPSVGVNTIPYHAIQYLEVTETSAEASRDAYGCD